MTEWLDPREKSRLVKDLMAARRAIKDAKGAGDHGAESEAHRMVDEASARLSGGRTERRRLIAANCSTMRLRSTSPTACAKRQHHDLVGGKLRILLPELPSDLRVDHLDEVA
jgi:hypothetical protein